MEAGSREKGGMVVTTGAKMGRLGLGREPNQRLSPLISCPRS